MSRRRGRVDVNIADPAGKTLLLHLVDLAAQGQGKLRRRMVAGIFLPFSPWRRPNLVVYDFARAVLSKMTTDGVSHWWAPQETRDDMLRSQADGIYPAAFASIKNPVLMVRGTFDPHPGPAFAQASQHYMPQTKAST